MHIVCMDEESGMRWKLDDKGCRALLSLAEEGVECVINKEGSIPFIHGWLSGGKEEGSILAAFDPCGLLRRLLNLHPKTSHALSRPSLWPCLQFCIQLMTGRMIPLPSLPSPFPHSMPPISHAVSFLIPFPLTKPVSRHVCVCVYSLCPH